MTERTQKQRTTSPPAEETTETAPAAAKQGEKIKADLDDLLDEIDSVLEDNAEEFVKGYVQKGGE